MWVYAFIILLVVIIVWLASRDSEMRHHAKRMHDAMPTSVTTAGSNVATAVSGVASGVTNAVSTMGTASTATTASTVTTNSSEVTAPAPTPVAAVTASVPAPTIGGATVVAAVATPVKEKFCPKLAHRYGFCDAGAHPESMNPARGTFYDQVPMSTLPLHPNYYQGFLPVRNADARDIRVEHPADGTMWGGYMHSSVLPM